MNPDKQRIAIAEAHGWQFPKGNGANGPFVVKPNGAALWTNDDPMNVITALRWNRIPDYLNDVRARREAWNALTAAQKMTFGVQARRVALRHGVTVSVFEAELDHWPEIYLRTIGKWEDEA